MIETTVTNLIQVIAPFVSVKMVAFAIAAMFLTSVIRAARS